MSKICMIQVYRKVLSEHGEEIEERLGAGHEVMGYDFETFKADMFSGDLISTVGTVRNKWDKMVSDRVLEIPSACGPYTKGLLWIDSLKAAAEGRRLVRASLPRTENASVCVSRFYISEHDAREGAQ